MGESGSTKGIYWYFQRVIMMKPTLKKQHREGGGSSGRKREYLGIYWYFKRVIMMKPTLKKQHIFTNKYNKYCDFLLIQKSVVIFAKSVTKHSLKSWGAGFSVW